jgi:DNA mismatch repair protein PMS2
MSSTRIEAIDKKSVARICSGQVVVDLASAVKELVENALVRARLFAYIILELDVLEGCWSDTSGGQTQGLWR